MAINTKMFDLTGKTALVTGGTSGIGKAIARAFVEHGARVLVGSRSQEKVEAAAAELDGIADVSGEDPVAGGVILDVANTGSVQRAVRKAVDLFGGLHIVVNSAGVMCKKPTFELTDAELPQKLERYFPAEDIPALIDTFRQSNPDAAAPELFFKLITARGYWLDSVLQTERKAAQQAAPVYSYRLMWHTPVEGGRRITPHSLDLPFIFDNVAVAPDMVGPPTDETEAMARVMSESWLAFARSGDPNNDQLPTWAP